MVGSLELGERLANGSSPLTLRTVPDFDRQSPDPGRIQIGEIGKTDPGQDPGALERPAILRKSALSTGYVAVFCETIALSLDPSGASPEHRLAFREHVVACREITPVDRGTTARFSRLTTASSKDASWVSRIMQSVSLDTPVISLNVLLLTETTRSSSLELRTSNENRSSSYGATGKLSLHTSMSLRDIPMISPPASSITRDTRVSSLVACGFRGPKCASHALPSSALRPSALSGKTASPLSRAIDDVPRTARSPLPDH
jgi:hypothetical protein